MIVLAAMILTSCSKTSTEQIAPNEDNHISISQSDESAAEDKHERKSAQDDDTKEKNEENKALNDKTKSDDNTEKPDGKVEISLEEAIEIGEEEANQYYENLKLTEVHSYDNDEKPESASGDDGKRQWWYVNFANEEENYVSVLIADGEIIASVPMEQNANDGFIDLDKVEISAEEAVNKAKELGLTGGDPEKKDDWVSGYNYKLSNGSLEKDPENKKIFFEVIGISPDGNFAHIDLDATTGEVILAEEKIEHPNGDVEWKEFGN